MKTIYFGHAVEHDSTQFARRMRCLKRALENGAGVTVFDATHSPKDIVCADLFLGVMDVACVELDKDIVARARAGKRMKLFLDAMLVMPASLSHICPELREKLIHPSGLNGHEQPELVVRAFATFPDVIRVASDDEIAGCVESVARREQERPIEYPNFM